MNFKSLVVIFSIMLLSACGGQNTENTQVIGAATARTTSMRTTSPLALTKNIGLMDSLAALYPQGKASAESAAKAAKAAKALVQNPAALRLTAPAPQPGYQSKASSKTQIKASATYADYQPVARIQNTTLEGSYFFSIYDAEIENALDNNPDWVLEGAAFWASLAIGDGLSPVHRLRNLHNGSYLYTIYEAEKTAITRDYSKTFTYEGVSWYARQTQADGWTPLYRFRNLINGTYLFSAYEEEKNLIQIWYDDIFALEGVAYYVRLGEPPPEPVVTAIAPLAATVGIPTVFVVEGTNLPLDSKLSFVNASCSAPVQSSATGFSQTCTPTGPVSVSSVSVIRESTSTIVGAKPVTLLAQTVEPVYTGNLPDTGITSTQCYGIGSNVLISCTSPAAIALNPKQDGMVGRDVTSPSAADGKLGFSYSDVPKPGGGVYAKTDCVKDNITGLTWEGKTASGLRSAINTYTNYDSTTEIQAWDGNSSLSATQAQVDAITNTVGYKNYVNSIALCGYTDWRLPEIAEIDVLLDLEKAPNAFNADTTWLPNNWGPYYWSSTGVAAMQDSMNAWLLNLSVGRKESFLRSVDMYVRLVRGGTTATTTRYSYLNNGTEVLDSKTKLIWRRCKEGAAWDGAACIGNATSFTHEQTLIHAYTQTGWRLPNIKELNSTFDFSAMWPYIDPAVSPPGRQFEHTYVSSTPNTNDPSSFWVTNGMYSRDFPAWTVKLVRNAP